MTVHVIIGSQESRQERTWVDESARELTTAHESGRERTRVDERTQDSRVDEGARGLTVK